MKIIVSSLYFYTDHSGIALYATDFAKYAQEEGHDVKVITGFPFYPNWKKRKEDRRRFFRIDNLGSIKIYRGYTYVPPKPSTLSRLIQEFFMLFFSIINYLRVGKHDLIVVFSTPVSFGFLGVVMKWLYRSKLIINVQDFQVEAASSLKMVKGSFFVDLLKKIEGFSYKHADFVSTISRSMINVLKEKHVPQEKILFWPNWINLNEIDSLKIENGTFRKRYDVCDEDIIIGYAGNIGLKQGLEVMVDLANEFLETPCLRFYIIGEGAGLEGLKDYYQKTQPKNITFLPFLKTIEYKEFLVDSDVIFVSQKKTNKDIYFPSKLLEIMAMSKTILLNADKDSELYKVLKDNNLAYVTDYKDLSALKEATKTLINQPGLKATFGENARSFVTQYDRKNILGKIINQINNEKTNSNR
ncbi:colanic acid biosynthesis glycosyl transferase WcaI [Ekhidna lutea]|uniref:Colanic acid biosynthesis glycosyl transferase WcaI n=1 Tax=Ekhidna lutea TaxID=447679 RepID=A0A239FFY1_EKHLU|nr:glycosyltransferase family 4 protein [Ekhidna lutea]SNS55930.1 colanic acid biosynthesis glycosyl transferase WcaI [Ekhidna lutea]